MLLVPRQPQARCRNAVNVIANLILLVGVPFSLSSSNVLIIVLVITLFLYTITNCVAVLRQLNKKVFDCTDERGLGG